jgi:tetratricopeptide (TPR) repeat protein
MDAGLEPMSFDDYDSGLTWLDQERENLIAVHRTAAAMGLHETVWQMAVILKQFYFVRRHYDDMLVANGLALAAARASSDPGAEALLLSGMGAAYWSLGRLDEAESSYRQALSVCRSTADRHGEGAALVDLGVVHAGRGDAALAVDTFTQALALLNGETARRKRGTCLLNLGVMRATLGLLHEAIDDSRQALEIFRRIPDFRQAAIALGNLAEFHRDLGDLEPALALSWEQQEVCRTLGDGYLSADTLLGLGDTFSAMNRFDEARQAWIEALAGFEQIGHSKAVVARSRLEE